MDFTTGPNTHIVQISLNRNPSEKFDNKLAGTIWLDDVSLTPLGPRNHEASAHRHLSGNYVCGAGQRRGGDVVRVGDGNCGRCACCFGGPSGCCAAKERRCAGARCCGLSLILALVWRRLNSRFILRSTRISPKLELLRVASYVLLLFLSLQAFRNTRHWQVFGWFILWFGFAVAVFAILQDLTFNGKIYWFRELPFGGVPFGPFVNRNHFAGFIELVVPMGLAFLAVRGTRRDQLPLVGLCTALPVGALMLSASRGGIFSFGAELIVLVLLLLVCGAQKRQLLAGLMVLGWRRRLSRGSGLARCCSDFPKYAILK